MPNCLALSCLLNSGAGGAIHCLLSCVETIASGGCTRYFSAASGDASAYGLERRIDNVSKERLMSRSRVWIVVAAWIISTPALAWGQSKDDKTEVVKAEIEKTDTSKLAVLK